MPQQLANRPRRTQQARSAATRAKLLDATIECVVTEGYAHTTTTRVCARAGVSQGALFKHFESKLALLGAAVEHLFAELVRDYREAFAQIAAQDDRIAAAIRLLWKTFSQPRLKAAFEIYTVARTDAGLRAMLEPVLERHRSNLRAEARALFPEAYDDNPFFDAVIDAVLDAMQGAALGALVLEDPLSEARRLAVLERLVRREFSTPRARRNQEVS